MKFSVFTLILPEYSFSEQLGLAKELGYDGVEVRVADVDPAKKDEPFSPWGNRKDSIGPTNIMERIPEMQAAVKATGVEICALAPYCGATEPEKFEPLAAAAARLKVPLVRVMAPWYEGKAAFERLFGAARKGLAEVARIARRHGVRAALEIHHGGLAASPSGARRLVDGLDPKDIGITLDPGNMVFEGAEDWRMACELLGPYLAHIHVKNAKWELREKPAAGPWVWQASWCYLNEGVANWKELMAALRHVKYDGWLSLEDLTGRPGRESMQAALPFLKSL